MFQCGKCKKQFNSLALFVNHKQQPCGSHSISNHLNNLQQPQQHVQQIYATQNMAGVQVGLSSCSCRYSYKLQLQVAISYCCTAL